MRSIHEKKIYPCSHRVFDRKTLRCCFTSDIDAQQQMFTTRYCSNSNIRKILRYMLLAMVVFLLLMFFF